MAKNIVLLSDGTGNSAASSTKTNVWRLYEALDLTRGDQVASFDDGVGTSSFAPLRYLGLALGIGVKRNVLDLYKFLCRTYDPDDRIHVFGFSRGAFTARLLCGLISVQGLARYVSEEQLERDARIVYARHRRERFTTPLLMKPFRILRDTLATVIKRPQPSGICARPSIAFLGVWDTVAAYGLPIDEMTIAVDKWVWPMRFADTNLPAKVEVARHAMALDDERRTFFPIPWTEPERQREWGADVGKDSLVQVWFAGMHADVGGGYPDDRLSFVPLLWMIGEARRYGLRFDEARLQAYEAVASFDGTRHDSRAGVGVAYRYQPRSISQLMNTADRRGQPRPLLHHSVIRRIAFGTDRYGPLSVDTDIDVLGEGNVVVPFRRSTEGEPPLAEVQVAIDTLLKTANGDRRARRTEEVDRVLDMVWWRRLLYFVMLGSLLGFALLPVVGKMLFGPDGSDGEAPAALSWINVAAADITTPLVAILRLFTPGAAESWMEALARYPVVGFGCLGLFALAWGSSARLAVRIRDWARAPWSDDSRDKLRDRDRSQKRRQILRWRMDAVLLIVLALVLRTGAGWVAAPEFADALAKAGTLSGLFGLAAAGIWGLLHWQARRRPEPAWWLLDLARRLRGSATLVGAYRWFARTALPVAALVGIASVFGLVVVNAAWNQAIFQIRSLTGGVCTASPVAAAVPHGGAWLDAPGLFRTSSLCWASGLKLEEGRRYEVALVIPDGSPDWFDYTTPAGLRGFPPDSMIRHLSVFLMRWQSQNFFTPIARIGPVGATELPLHPVAPPPDLKPLDKLTQAKVDALMKVAEQSASRSAPIWHPWAVAASEWLSHQKNRERGIVATFIAPKGGELFLYVNDAIPNWLADTYANNTGLARVMVRDSTEEWPCTPAEEKAKRALQTAACKPYVRETP